MSSARMTLAIGSLIAGLVACSSDDSGARTCPAGCPPGQCDTATGSCRVAPTCTATGTPVRLCGQTCVDITSDASHCGACFNSCNGQVCANSVCGSSTTPPPNTACDAKKVNACGAQNSWCNAALGVCRTCPGAAASFNCDGLDGCECGNGCDGTKCAAGPTLPPSQCDPVGAETCGKDTAQYCDANSLTCVHCEGVMSNCDYTNTCECNQVTHECDNGACRPRPTPTKPTTCGEKQYWDGTTCHDCPQFDYDCNADASDGCECKLADDVIGCYWDGTCDKGMD